MNENRLPLIGRNWNFRPLWAYYLAMNRFLLCLSALTLAGCTTAQMPQGDAPTAANPDVIPYNQVGLERLLNNQGITLQWIGWDQRGQVRTHMDNGALYITGTQSESGGPGELFVQGKVIEIGSNYFILDGTISISDTPDRGRACEQNKFWHFAITQNRAYYRLREFEWCDGLTDYVDIYF